MPAAYRFATVNDQALLGDARAWRERAARLLEASDLPVLLREHGRIVFSGSYAYDTMMSPDIDLHLLLNAFSRQGAVEVLDALIHQDWWNTYTFGDWVQEPVPGDRRREGTQGVSPQARGDVRGQVLERRCLGA